jgi:hypothetical protein
MTTKELNIKSARKKFMVMKTKGTILQMQQLADDKVDVELEKILKSLVSVFGEEAGEEILVASVEAADRQMDAAMQEGMATIMQNKINEAKDK